MKNFQLSEKVKKFLVPGILLLAALFIAGGFYFRHRGLNFGSQLSTIEEEGGAVSGTQTGLPKNFPNDIPLFAPSEILSSLESRERTQVTLETRASVARVLEFYQQKMKEGGWRLTGRGTTNDSALTFVGDKRQVQIVITADPTLIVLSVTSPN